MPFYKRLTRLLSGTPQAENKPRPARIALSKEDVRRLAGLARLHFSEAEEEKLAEELSRILEYTGKLRELDTAGVPPMTRVLDGTNVERPDEAETRLAREDALGCALDTDGEYFRAPNVME